MVMVIPPSCVQSVEMRLSQSRSGWEELLPNNNFRLSPVEPERGRISQERG